VVTDFNFDLEYENIMSLRTMNEKSKFKLGMRTTKKTKSLGCSVFKELVRDQKLYLQDQNTINEISTFVKKATSYEAEVGKHDDIVMSIVNMAYATTTTQFEEIFNMNVSKTLLNNNRKDIEEDVLPPPLISNGIDTFEGNNFNNIFEGFDPYDRNDPDMKGF